MEEVAGPRRRHRSSAALGGMSIAITAWSEFVQADRGVAYRIFESIGRSERPTRRPSELFSRNPTPMGGSDENYPECDLRVGHVSGLARQRFRGRWLSSGLERGRPDCRYRQQAPTGHQ